MKLLSSDEENVVWYIVATSETIHYITEANAFQDRIKSSTVDPFVSGYLLLLLLCTVNTHFNFNRTGFDCKLCLPLKLQNALWNKIFIHLSYHEFIFITILWTIPLIHNFH